MEMLFDYESFTHICGMNDKEMNVILDKKMIFGKYKGMKYRTILGRDQTYCSWLCYNIKQPKGSLSDFIFHYKKYDDYFTFDVKINNSIYFIVKNYRNIKKLNDEIDMICHNTQLI